MNKKQVREDYVRILNTAESAQKDHRKKMDHHKDELTKLRKICQHEELTFHPDPSGNNDSCYICDWCGKEARRKSGFNNE